VRNVSAAAGRVAVVFGSDPAVGRATAPSPRLVPVFAALAELGLAVEPVGYGAGSADEIRDRLIAADGVLAWVDARQYPPGLSPEERAAQGLALDADVPAGSLMGLPSAKTMYPPGDRLRRLVEQDWVPGMQAILGLRTGSLPVLWDADFLFGPKTAEGADSYVLCEINASSAVRSRPRRCRCWLSLPRRQWPQSRPAGSRCQRVRGQCAHPSCERYCCGVSL
jgi:hypothetical protein